MRATGESDRQYWQRVDEVFNAVIETPPPERAARLIALCGSYAALREDVERLLESDGDMDIGFLQPPAALPLAAPPTLVAAGADVRSIQERPGTVIGPYTLHEQIGEGGFGVVYLAEQERPVRRRVALKVIKPGMDTRQVISRFQAERQALAMMDHPHIARVLDGGETESGRPYFVMELVKGIAITEYCDQCNLTTRDRLELFVPVCQAVQHAHQKGIIHRDLKPSNVMIAMQDGHPAPKVIDFGVAKAINQRLTEHTLYTQFAQMVGTPLYMSPEQAEMSPLEVDTRSDIYSLGAMLYELLTGTTPFERERLKEAGFDEVRRIIRQEEPPTPSTRIRAMSEPRTPALYAQRQGSVRADVPDLQALDVSGDSSMRVSARDESRISRVACIAQHRRTDPRKLHQLVRGDLDWIVMKALEKDRTRRYETASGFAADVRRYLDDEPVEACPPSAMYRLRKLARRNKAAFVAASAIAVGVLLAVAGLAVSNVQIRKEQTQKELALAAARESAEQAREAVDDFFTIVSENELFDMAGMQPVRKQLLEAALDHYRQFVAQHPDDLRIQAAQAAAHFRMWQIYLAVDQYDDATAELDRGLDIVEQLHRAHPNDPELLAILTTVRYGGEVFHNDWTVRRRLEARQTLERGVRIWETLAAGNPTIPQIQRCLVETYDELANLRRYAGYEAISPSERQTHSAGALAAGQKALEIMEWLGRHHPALREGDGELELRRGGLSVYLRDVGKLQEAETAVRQSLDYFEKQAALFPAVRRHQDSLARLQRRLAELLSMDSRRAQETEQAWQRAIDSFEDLAAEYPGLPSYLWLLGSSHLQFGQLLKPMGRTEEAEQAYNKGLRIFEKLVSDYPNSHAYWGGLQGGGLRGGHDLLADLFAATGRREEAEKILRNMIELLDKRAAEHPDNSDRVEIHAQLAAAWHNLGCLLRDLRPQEAEAAFRQARDLYGKVVAESPHDLYARRGQGWSCWEHGNRLLAAGRLEEAVVAFRESLAATEVHPDTDAMLFLAAHNHGALGRASWQAGRPEEAEPQLRKSIDLFEKVGTDWAHLAGWLDSTWGIRESRNALISLLRSTGRPTEAEQVTRQNIEFYEQLVQNLRTRPHGRAPELASALTNLAETLRQTGKPAEARPLAEEAVEICQRHADQTEPWQRERAFAALRNVLNALGDVSTLEAVATEFLRSARTKLTADDPYLAVALAELADALRQNGKPSEARPLAEEAMAICQRLPERVHPWQHCHVFHALSQILTALGDTATLEDLATQTLQNSRANASRDDLWLAVALANLANVLRDNGKLAEARPLAEEAVEICQRHPDRADVWQRDRAYYALRDVLTGLGDAVAVEALDTQRLQEPRAALPAD